MTRLSRPELSALTLDLSAETEDVLAQDGPRNASLFWTRARTAARFRDTPHAFPAAPSLPASAQTAYDVAEAWRTSASVALAGLEQFPEDPVAADHAYRAMCQYAAAVEQFAGTLQDASVVLFHHLEEVVQTCARS